MDNRRKSSWILAGGMIMNLLVYAATPFGRGIGFHVFIRQLTTVTLLTLTSFGIVYCMAWLGANFTKRSLSPVPRAIISCLLCTALILLAAYDVSVRG